MDDIDDLLDEVEKDLEVSNRNNRKLKKLNKDAKFNDVEDDVNSILNEDYEFKKNTKEQVNKSTTTFNKRCSILYLGGSNQTPGLNTSLNKCPCSFMRCTSCDFKVDQFDDFEWCKSVDYLFLRNNMPNFSKISKKLIKRKGCRSYVCQCCWKSVISLTKVQNFVELKWVCGKH